jgi:hypothetical protein
LAPLAAADGFAAWLARLRVPHLSPGYGGARRAEIGKLVLERRTFPERGATARAAIRSCLMVVFALVRSCD